MTEAIRPYQVRMIDEITGGDRRRGLFPSYGAGKGWIALKCAAVEQRAQHCAGAAVGIRAVVFCRNRNRLSWRTEIAKRAPECEVLEDNEGLTAILNRRERETRNSPIILLMPHHRICPLESRLVKLLGHSPPAALIMDESTKIKNPSTQRAQACIRLALLHHGLRLCLSGKPMPECPQEIWSQFAFCFGKATPFGLSYYRFLNMWFIKCDWQWMLDFSKRDKFYRIIDDHSVYLLPEDKEYLERNKQVNYVIEQFDETTEQRRLLDHLYAHWELPTRDQLDGQQLLEGMEFAGIGEEYRHTISVSMKAQQIASGFYYDSQRKPIYLRLQPKLDALGEIVKELFDENPTRKVIIWHRFVAEVAPAVVALEKVGVVDYAIGPDDEALQAFEKSVEPGAGKILQTPRAIFMPCGESEGFNELSIADTSVFLSTSYSQEKRDQAEARHTGARQRYPMSNIIDICGADMADHEIITALQMKSFSFARLDAIVRKRSKMSRHGDETLPMDYDTPKQRPKQGASQ